MSDERPARGTVAARTKTTISAELDAARARLHALHPLIERETERLRRFKQRLAQAQNKWRVERPDEPFDPEFHSPPLVWVPHPEAEANQLEFHRLHYTIKELEDELKAQDGPKPSLAKP